MSSEEPSEPRVVRPQRLRAPSKPPAVDRPGSDSEASSQGPPAEPTSGGGGPDGAGSARVEPSRRLPAWAHESTVVRLAGGTSAMEPLDQWQSSDGAGVRVAVLDSGIEDDHPGLDGCVDAEAGVWVQMDDDGIGTVDRPGAHPDAFGHGTACAGIIHAIAPAARLTSIRVLGENCGGKAPAFLRGLAWAIEQRFDVVNLSLGTTKRDWALPFYELADAAYFAGVVLVTAANNVNRVSFPSLFGSVISVACHGGDDPERYHFNPDPPTEFLARGIDVPLLWPEHTTIVGTGNSYAAPHVTGLVARVRSAHPGLSPFRVKAALWAGAANVREAGSTPVPAGRLTAALRGAAPAASPRATAALGVIRELPILQPPS